MCSMRCERPASSSPSPTLPAPIQNPSATDRTEPMDSVTTRTPESSSVSLGAVRVPPSAPARAAGAAAAAGPTVAAAVGVPAGGGGRGRGGGRGPPPPPPPRPPARARSLGVLAGDVGVVGQAQADAAAL